MDLHPYNALLPGECTSLYHTVRPSRRLHRLLEAKLGDRHSIVCECSDVLVRLGNSVMAFRKTILTLKALGFNGFGLLCEKANFFFCILNKRTRPLS
jgi:hypothetical protein